MNANALPAVGPAEERKAAGRTGRKSSDDGGFARELGNATADEEAGSPQEAAVGKTSAPAVSTTDSGGEKESGRGGSDSAKGNASDYSGLLVIAALTVGPCAAAQPAVQQTAAADAAKPAVAAANGGTAAVSAVPVLAQTDAPVAAPAVGSGQKLPEPGAAAEIGPAGSAVSAAADAKAAAEIPAAAPAVSDKAAQTVPSAAEPVAAAGLPAPSVTQEHSAAAPHAAPPAGATGSAATAAAAGIDNPVKKGGTAAESVMQVQPETERKTEASPAPSADGPNQTARWPAAAIRSPAGTAADSVTPPGGSGQSAHVARQIASALQNDSAAGRSQLRVHLSPADLGGINLRLLTENGRVTLQITADSSRTGALLNAHLEDLNQSLNQSGVTMDRTEVFCQTGGGDSGTLGGWAGGGPPGFDTAGGGSGRRSGVGSGSAPARTADFPAGEDTASPSWDAPGRMSFFA